MVSNDVLCPFCHSTNIIPIVYGYPGSSNMNAYLEACDKGEIKPGGCCVEEGMPTHHCKDCKQDLGSLKL